MTQHRDTELDEMLVRCASQTGDDFGELYDRTIGHSFRLASWLAHERVAAERILLRSYVEVRRNAATFDPARGSAMSWVLATVRSCG